MNEIWPLTPWNCGDQEEVRRPFLELSNVDRSPVLHLWFLITVLYHVHTANFLQVQMYQLYSQTPIE